MAQKIAILGGGPAGLVTALELTDPSRAGMYDVTVYQQGGRLGGKCASSRNPAEHERNEEHGLHVWFGCYENAFSMMDKVYNALPPADRPFPTIWDAFFARPYTVLGQGSLANPDRWDVTFPAMPGKPGDGTPIRTPHEMVGYVVQVFHDLVLQAIREARAATSDLIEKAVLFQLELDFRAIMAPLMLLPLDQIADKLLFLANAVGGLTLLSRIQLLLAPLVAHVGRGSALVAKSFAAADLLLAGLSGLLDPTDNALKNLDLDVLDKYEFSAWLSAHGADPRSLDSAFIRAVYECMFQYTDGDRTKPSYAAGVAVRTMLRIGTTYKGEVLYLPAAGFGELIIAPIYEVLRARGVKFAFFHRVTELQPDAAGVLVDKVVISVQAAVIAGEYKPLTPLAAGGVNFKVWRSEPDWAQLAGGVPPAPVPDFESYWEPATTGTITLQAGVDFDRVVLAIPVTAQREIAAPLMAVRASWQNMVAAMPPVPNVALQLWMDRTGPQLGWLHAPALDAGPPPFDVWTDMSLSIGYEAWPAGGGPMTAHYLCGVMDTDLHLRPRAWVTTPAEAHAQARNQAIAFLDTDAFGLWPSTYGPGQVFQWSALHAPAGVVGAQRIDHQYIRANVDPTEVTHGSPPGSTAQRFYAGDSGFDNLIVAGDWIRTGLNSAAVEAAFMSGRQAARAIYGGTAEVPGEYWMSRRPAHLPVPGAPPALVPQYVSRIGRGEQAMPAPGVMTDAKLAVFVLQGQKAHAQALVDRFLNAPCGQPGRYVVDSDAVLISFMDAKMTSGGAAVGWLPDRECAVWIGLTSGGKRLFWMPYIFVDTSIAMVTGREIWGFAKEVGRIDLGAGSWKAYGTTFDPMAAATQGQESEIVVATETAPPGFAGAVFATIGAFAIGAAGTLVEELFGVPEPLVVNLKQFRDATVPGLACYQSIVESRFHIDTFTAAGVLAGTYEVRLPVHASHSIAADLGLNVVNVPVAAFSLEMGFTALAGTEVWRSR